MIPKIIHYCWLSGDPVPPAYQRCMDSWKETLSGYEFVLWDTARFDLSSLTWTRQAFEAQLYAYAADYIRLYAVYHHGGIYLDMDMEVLKPFDELLASPLMLAYENHLSSDIEAGCFGAEAAHPYIKKCMAFYESRPLYRPALSRKVLGMERQRRNDYLNPPMLPAVMARMLPPGGVTVYPREYFTAKNIRTGLIEKTERTFCVHHFAAQYHSAQWFAGREIIQNIRAAFGGKRKILVLLASCLVSLMTHISDKGYARGFWYCLTRVFTRRRSSERAARTSNSSGI